jgi:hypothetical protein
MNPAATALGMLSQIASSGIEMVDAATFADENS